VSGDRHRHSLRALLALMKSVALIAALALFTTGCTGTPSPGTSAAAGPSLKLASWNTEHLAEANGSGCRPRTDADYASMRAYVDGLGADVIAFQEVETKAAAERVFDPATYTVVIEDRVGTNRGGFCRGREGLTINAQRTGFAVRKGIPFDRQPDFTAIQVGNPDLRSGVDLIVRPGGGEPIRVLSVHLKSGCSSGASNEACPVLFEQVPIMEQWIDQRAAEGVRFAVLGDFNRRLAMPNDSVWADWDDASPSNADLALASGDQSAQCNPRYRDFIDFIVLDRRATGGLRGFEEKTFEAESLADHCAVAASLSLR
jgi:endonuclease/exonuclease/phosphatase family metal-dependent hydrolase